MEVSFLGSPSIRTLWLSNSANSTYRMDDLLKDFVDRVCVRKKHAGTVVVVCRLPND